MGVITPHQAFQVITTLPQDVAALTAIIRSLGIIYLEARNGAVETLGDIEVVSLCRIGNARDRPKSITGSDGRVEYLGRGVARLGLC